MAGVHSIQIRPSLCIPASPAMRPSGTLKDTQKPAEEARGM